VILELTQRPWANSTPTEPKDPCGDSKGFSGAYQLAASDDSLHRQSAPFSPKSDQAPSGGAAKRPEPAPSASVRSFLDPDTLSLDSTNSLREQLRLVNQRIDDVRTTLRTKDECGEGPLRCSPFIQDAPIPSHFCIPMLEAYDGSSDPTEHVVAFHAQMTLYGTSDVIMCRAFLTTLRGIARGWYSRLSPSSIDSFDQLAREFKANFLSSARPKPTIVSLLGMRQKEEEHLGQYLAHFTDEAFPLLLVACGVRPHDCTKNVIEGQSDVTVETLVAKKREDQKCSWVEPSRGPPSRLPRRRMERGEQTIPRPPNIPLNSTRMEIFLQIREKGLLKTPNPIRSQAEDRDRRRYCRFHRDYGHDTKECYDLKNQIENLIHCDHLDRYIMKSCESSLHPKGLVER
ncbi:hypothetical protein B296_00049334, partial [Ensete ventricosum]